MPTHNVNGCEFFYEESGKGMPLVLLHGFPLDSRVWVQQRAALSDRVRVITPDLRGFGKSKSTDAFTMASVADDVHALLQDMGALPCILGGLSMGGYAALEYVRRHAADMKGLLLIDTRAEADTPEGKVGREKMIQMARKKGSTAVADAMMPKLVAPGAEAKHPAMVRELRAIMEACPALTIEHALQAMLNRADHSGNLASIKVPTLVVVGERDLITPVAMSETMRKGIAGSKLAVIPDAGHMACMERGEQVSVAIGDFLKTLSL